MPLMQDYYGNARNIAGQPSKNEFERIFGFSDEIIRGAALTALRVANEVDDRHSQTSGQGSIFYHTFIAEIRTAVDVMDEWTANQEGDNHTAPRMYRSDGLGLAFVQGGAGTADIKSSLYLKKPLGVVTMLEIQQGSFPEQLELSYTDFADRSMDPALWLIVYHREGNVVRLEVSNPEGVTEDGKITGWRKRLVLEDVDMNDQIIKGDDSGEQDEDGDVNVPISVR
ncbi:hypothetical protein [Bifidobacterium subtile]|jgi:hypothetical protein|uniref:hypothetical protein n=1 Tax=Bifidobacterium subtile TaxID=77635 RepID=UPI002F354F22